MIFKHLAKIKIVLVSAIILCISAQAQAMYAWENSEQGFEFKVEGISKTDQLEAQEALKNWQKQTTQFFRTLQALDISYDEFVYMQQAYRKIEFGLVYRFDIASANKKGVLVVAVSPLSFMQKLGVKNGDVIFEVNGLSLANNLEKNDKGQSVAATKLTSFLKSLKENDAISLKVYRNDEPVLLSGNVSGLNLPEIKLVAKAPILKEANGSNCATVSTLDFDSPSKSLYKVQILNIDGRQFRSVPLTRLVPDRYQVQVRERILDPRLSVNLQPRYRIKTLELVARPGKSYVLAAEFQKEHVKNKDKFWKLKVIEKDISCVLD